MTVQMLLSVPWSERRIAARLGARWSPTCRRWTSTATQFRTAAFKRWRNKSSWRRVRIHPDETPAGYAEAKANGCSFDPVKREWFLEITNEDSLTAWHLDRLTHAPAYLLDVDYSDREAAKRHGARWHKDKKTWVVVTRAPLGAWLSKRVRGQLSTAEPL